MDKWEYSTWAVRVSPLDEKTKDALNKLGLEGWELVSVVASGWGPHAMGTQFKVTDASYIFKRRIE